MLTITFKETDNVVPIPPAYFMWQPNADWITDEYARKMIKDIDKADVLDSCYITTPWLGTIPPEFLSGGVITLLCIINCPDKIFNATYCGSNCEKYLLDIGKNYDRTVYMQHIMMLKDCSEPFDIKFSETGETVHSREEYLAAAKRAKGGAG